MQYLHFSQTIINIVFQKLTPFFLIATLIFLAHFYFVNIVTTFIKGSELQKPSLKTREGFQKLHHIILLL